MSKMSAIIKKFISILIFGALIGAFGTAFVQRYAVARIMCKQRWLPKELKNLMKQFLGQDWLVVFIHGTFGSTMSLLDLPTVNNDQVQGSKYKGFVDKIRNNPIFWRDQAVLSRGLVFVDPQQVPVTEEQMLSGAHVLTKSFLEIDKLVDSNRNVRTYTFGWSGLLSQQRRRREAVRLYNQLAAEIDRLENEEGIVDPKIELISHSHGGNLALNLAAIYHWLQGDLAQLLRNNSLAVDEFDKELKELKPFNDSGRNFEGQHYFDYLPIKSDLKVDRLIMLGTPVQPKTFCLAASRFFFAGV